MFTSIGVSHFYAHIIEYHVYSYRIKIVNNRIETFELYNIGEF